MKAALLRRRAIALRALLAAAALVVAGLAATLGATPAWAHANYARSMPSANAVLDESPRRVSIWFTEPLEARFSEIRVLDGAGARVDSGDSVVDSNDPTLMSVGLPPLPDGTYTAAWRNLSTVDGHRLRGAFVFSVGEPISAAASETAAGDDGALWQTPYEPALRWGLLLGGLSLTGGLMFRLLVSDGVIAAAGRRSPLGRMRRRLEARSRGLLWASVGLALLASVAQLLTQAALLFETTLAGAAGAPALELLATEWGGLWLWRIGLLLGAGAALALPLPSRLGQARRQWFGAALRWVALAASLGALLTISMSSHAAATPGIARLALVNDAAHLAAAAVWVGGLFHLIAGTPLFLGGGRESWRRAITQQASIVRRFSALAALSVITLIATGAYSAWAQVTLPAALATPYGYALAVKIGLIAPLLLLGAVNLVWVRPRLARGGAAARWLRRIVIGEAALAALVLLAVGFLTSMEPARQVASQMGIGQAEAAEFSDIVEGAEIALAIAPARVGANTLTVRLSDALGQPIADAEDVRARLSYLEADFGEEWLPMVNAGGGAYALSDAVIGIAGAWQAELLVQRADAFDARTAFRFEAAQAGGLGSAAIAPNPADAVLYMGIGTAVVGLLFLVTAIPMGGMRNRGAAVVMACGAAAMIAGAFMAGGALEGGDTRRAARNPILPTSASVAAGKIVYERYCASCHGDSGLGDGPAAAGLEPPPADLAVHVPLHPDADLYGFVSEGIEGTAMAALGDRLSEEEIWHVINYARALAEDGG